MRPLLVCWITLAMLRSASAATPLEQIMEQYFRIHESLAADSINGVSDAAGKIAILCNQAAATQPAAKKQLTGLSTSASRLKSSDLESARKGFGQLSKQMIGYWKIAGTKTPAFQFYCSMANERWLQTDKNTRNPYFGKAMLTCGEMVH